LFSNRLHEFGVLVGKYMTPEQKRVYWDALKHMSAAEFEHAATELMRTWKWPRVPYPADFLVAAKAGWV
jgi:hypothetical protein